METANKTDEKILLVGEVNKMMHELDYDELLRFRDVMVGGVLIKEVHSKKMNNDPPDKKGA